MLEIINPKGLVMDLPANYSVTIEKFNPLFNDAEKFFQDTSYPGSAPMSPGNKIFFNNAHLLETPNASYEQSVFVNLDGIALFEALCVYKVNEEQFEFTLKPNYAAVAKQLDAGYLTELHTNDADYSAQTVAEFKSLMLNTCKNPQNYPFIFFPLYNNKFWSAPDYAPPAGQHDIVNNFNYETQSFEIFDQTTVGNYAEVPFFKLSHVIGKVIESLGFNPSGNFFTDPDENSIYVYTRRAGNYFAPYRVVLPSSAYMPSMLIKDFLTETRQRIHLAFDFDLANRSCQIQSFKSLVNSPIALDLTRYIEAVTDIAVPEKKGYTVYLKPDDQDELTSYETADETKPRPDERLVIGNGEQEVPLDCGTLKSNVLLIGDAVTGKVVMAKQPFRNVNFKSWTNFEDIDPANPLSFNNWQLRLIRYDGFNEVKDSKCWPASSPFNLATRDIQWYQFLNDCKQAVLRINIPPVILGQLKLTSKYSFTTREGNYTEFIIEKMDYTVSSRSTELMAVDVYIKTLNNQATTKAVIEPWPEPVEHTGDLLPIGLLIKSYFNEELHGITSLQMQIINQSGTAYTYHVDPITQPTDKNGIGGSGSYLQQDGYLKNAFVNSFDAEIRITQGKPRFLDYMGRRYEFTAAAGYFYTRVFFDSDTGITSCWIAF
jgi:hypothetical protein